MEGGQQIIIIVPIPIRPKGAFLCDRPGILQRQGQRIALRHPGGKQHFHRVQRLPDVPAAPLGNVLQSAVPGLCGKARPGFQIGNRPADRL